MNFDYYLACVACPAAMVNLPLMIYWYTKQTNRHAKALCLFYAFIWACDFLIAFKIIMSGSHAP